MNSKWFLDMASSSLNNLPSAPSNLITAQIRLTKPCYSYAELAETGIEPGTSGFPGECSTN